MPPVEKSTSKENSPPATMASTPTSAVGSPDEQQPPTTSPAAATVHGADPTMHLSQHPEAAVARVPAGGGNDDSDNAGSRRHPIECEFRTGEGFDWLAFPASPSVDI